jgi:hydrogenase maturation protein HypF
LRIRAEHSIRNIALSGGVFQNRLLVELCVERLESAGFNVHIPESVPVNDAGLSYGQIIEYANRRQYSNG